MGEEVPRPLAPGGQAHTKKPKALRLADNFTWGCMSFKGTRSNKERPVSNVIAHGAPIGGSTKTDPEACANTWQFLIWLC